MTETEFREVSASPQGVHLYHAVDEQDRVYVASFDQNTGQVLIRLYELDGLNLKERGRFQSTVRESRSCIMSHGFSHSTHTCICFFK